MKNFTYLDQVWMICMQRVAAVADITDVRSPTAGKVEPLNQTLCGKLAMCMRFYN